MRVVQRFVLALAATTAIVIALAQEEPVIIFPNELLFVLDLTDVTDRTDFENTLQGVLDNNGYQLLDELPDSLLERVGAAQDGLLYPLGGPAGAARDFGLCRGDLGRVIFDPADKGALGDDPVQDLEIILDLLATLEDAAVQAGQEAPVLHIDPQPGICTEAGVQPGNEEIDVALAAIEVPLEGFSGDGATIAIIDTGIGEPAVVPLDISNIPVNIVDEIDLFAGDTVAEDIYLYDFIEDHVIGTPLAGAPYTDVYAAGLALLAADPSENTGHGTVLAALASRVAPEVAIIDIRVCDELGFCRGSDVVKGICYALGTAGGNPENPLVLNLSLSAPYQEFEEQDYLDTGLTGSDLDKLRSLTGSALRRVLETTLPRDHIAVAASGGNSAQPELRMPSAFDLNGGVGPTLDGLVPTAALVDIGESDWIPDPENTWGTHILLGAPGTFLRPAGDPEAGYSGSSYSTALMSGALAVLLPRGVAATDAEACLLNTAQPVPDPQGQQNNVNMIGLQRAMADCGVGP